VTTTRQHRLGRPRTALAVAVSMVAASFLLVTPAGALPPSWHLTRTFAMPIDTMTAVSCTSTKHCVTTTDDGRAVATKNGWSSFTTFSVRGARLADDMNGVACTTATKCEAVGGWGTATVGHGVIAGSTNGGVTWVAQHTTASSGPWPLYAISCTSSTTCLAAGVKGGHTNYWASTTNGGATWVNHIGTIGPSVGGLEAVSCLTGGFCAVLGIIDSSANTGNSGGSWHVGTSYPTVHYFWGLSCVVQDIHVCYAVGSDTKGHAIVLLSRDGGLDWTPVTIPSGLHTLYGVTCLNVTHCFAVGTTGTTDTNGHGAVLVTTNGATWTAMSVPHVVAVLKAVTCLTSSWCTAVGANAAGDAVALTYH
jgi:hypothetical protein